jgi:hypothetical protein
LEERRLLAIGIVADQVNHSAIVFDTDTNTALGSITLPGFGPATGDVALTADGQLGFVTDFQSRVWVLDLSDPSAPALASGPNPIPIANPGEDLAITPDQRFLVA